MFPGMKINTHLHHAVHFASEAATVLGTLAGTLGHHTKLETQLGKMDAELRRQTRTWPVSERLNAFTYGMDCLLGQPSYVHPTPEVQRVVTSALTKAKAA